MMILIFNTFSTHILFDAQKHDLKAYLDVHHFANNTIVHYFPHCKKNQQCKKLFSRFVITTYFLLSNQLYNNLFS